MTYSAPRVLLLVVAALLPRLAASAFLGESFHFIDETIYVDAASQLRTEGAFAPDYTNVPAYPVILALLSLPFGAGVLALRGMQAVLTAAGILLVVALTERFFGKRAALFAGVLYILDPLMVISSALLYPETIAALLIMTAVMWARSAAERGEASVALLLGLTLGVAALLRPVALLLLPCAALWLALAGSSPTIRRCIQIVVLCVAFLSALAPWTFHNFQRYGRLTPISYAGTGDAPVEAGQVEERGLAGAILHKAFTEPGELASHMTERIAGFWSLVPVGMYTDDPDLRAHLNDMDERLPADPSFPLQLRDLVSALSFGVELLLALVGSVIAARTRPRETLLLVGVAITFTLGYSLFGMSIRYRIPILPLVFALSGVGAAYTFDRLRGVSFRARPR